MSRFPGLLVRLFPADFREQFGTDICEQIDRDAQRARHRSRLAGVVFALATALDLIRSALAERRRPSWTKLGLPSPERPERGTMLTRWTSDLRHALYTLRRAPGFAAATIATLGLAIGVNVAIFAVVDAVLLNPLPFPSADRLVNIASSAPGSDFPEEFGVSSEFFLHFAERSQLLESVSTYNSFTNTLQVDDHIERVRMSWPTSTIFETLEAAPILGRLPGLADGDDVVVISHALWTTWFESDPEVLGKTVRVSGADRPIVGVMGPEFWFPTEDVLLWLSSTVLAEDIQTGVFRDGLIGRVAPGVDHDALTNELAGLARELPERFGGSAAYARLIEQYRPVIDPVRERLLGPVSGPLWILFAAVAIVLLIACANVANLFTVRAEHRQRDLAVRRALGAARSALIRVQMAEVAVVAGLSGALALLLAWVGVPAVVRATPGGVPRITDVSIDSTTLLFALGTAVFAALVCGLVPALRASSPRLTRLQESGRSATRHHHWGRSALVVGQTALALVLLIGSGLLLRSFWELRQVDPGYDIGDIFTFQIAPDNADLRDGPSFARFHTDFAARVAALPGVESVGIIENVPLNEGLSGTRVFTEATVGDPEGGQRVNFTWATGDYFATMGIEVLHGRVFEPSDHESTLGNVMISKTAADLLWPGQQAVGQQIRRNASSEIWETVVGVVEDVMQYGFRDEPLPLMYFPLVGPTTDSRPLTSPAYVVKTARADTIGPEIRALVREVAPTAPMYRTFTMAGLAADSMVDVSFTMLMLGIASALALTLGAIGLFGVLSYVVAERTREIGLRMALGAEAIGVQRMVVAQGARLLITGVVIGLAVAAATTGVLTNLLYGVEPADLSTFVGMSLAMLMIGMLASYLPARRASSVDPIESLRTE